MNTVTHFFTGYLVGRLIFKKKNDHFLTFFAAMVAIIPDIDEFLHVIIPIVPLEHAVFTHTIIGAFLFTLIYTSIIWAIGRNFLKELGVNFSFLLIIALVAMASHLFLDIFTYRAGVETTNAHLYFWPLWNFSFHLNAIFPEELYPNIQFIRIVIEVVYSAVIGLGILIYGWFVKKENPFFAFFPNHWWSFFDNAQTAERFYKTAFALLGVNLIIVGLMFSSLFLY